MPQGEFSESHILFAPVIAAIRLPPSTAFHHANTRNNRPKIQSTEFPPSRRPRTRRARFGEPDRLKRRRTLLFLRQTFEDPAGHRHLQPGQRLGYSDSHHELRASKV